MATLSNTSPPVETLVVNRSAFIAAAMKAFLYLAAPFELASFALMLSGSTGFSWWRLLMPNALSLIVGGAIIMALPTSAIGTLAKSAGLSCLLGVIVIASSVCAYLVTLTKTSRLPSSLSSHAEFIGVVCTFSIPFGLLCGLFFYGAATRGGSQSVKIESDVVPQHH
jgi:hypothetical protein